MSNLLTILKKQIDTLEQKIQMTEQSEYQEYYFDEYLFATNKIETDLIFYLDKIKQTYQALYNNVQNQQVERISFLSEMLVNQITALTRELATHQMRKTLHDIDIIDETLYEKHSRHLDYLRRLQEMKFELALSKDVVDHKQIASLDNRIYRCEQAIKKIELDMENDSAFIN